jgi:hypothetical protein
MTDQEIHKLCEQYDIQNYTINNGLVDVEGDVDVGFWRMDELPLRFGSVTGSFDCTSMGLTTLKGCPHTVGTSFYCGSNRLTSLEHCPVSIGTFFNCDDNRIDDVNHLPEHLGKTFYCKKNPIGSIFTGVDQDFLQAFKIYKVIKGNEVNLKRLKYVMGLFGKIINIEKIEQYYKLTNIR